MGKYSLKILYHISLFVFLISCSKSEPIIDSITDKEEYEATTGIVNINFIFNENNGCSVRYEILIAKDFYDLYISKRYVASPNVYANKQIYEVNLKPGKYVYMATTKCTCVPDFCAIYGYGGPDDTKEFVEEFTVELGKTTYLTTFNMGK